MKELSAKSIAGLELGLELHVLHAAVRKDEAREEDSGNGMVA